MRRWIPSPLVERLSGWLGKAIRFSGPYASWSEAVRRASGYDSAAILRAVQASTARVVRGEARWERDGVTFDEPAPPSPLLAVLLRAALENQGKLEVLDFGGALGSTYFQCRESLAATSLKWSIVEQAHFVECGRREFATPALRFHASMAEALREGSPAVAIASGVLQYLREPETVLAELVSAAPAYIFIDRAPIAANSARRIVVQHNPRALGGGSYPSWHFQESDLRGPLQARYECIGVCPTVDGAHGAGRLRAVYRGYAFRRR